MLSAVTRNLCLLICVWRTVKGLGFLPCLEINELACYYFVDAGRRHKTLGRRQRTLLFTAEVVARAFCWFMLVCSQSPRTTKAYEGDKESPWWVPTHAMGCEEHWNWEFIAFIAREGKPVLWGRCYLIPQHCLFANTVLRNGLGKKQTGPCILGIPSKNT